MSKMEPYKRTPLLEALCILSFAGNGIAILMYGIATVWNQPVREWIKEWSSMYDVSGYTQIYFLIFTILYAFSFLGVIKMWRLKKTGFLYYFFSQTAILFIPTLWQGKPVFSSVVIIFTILFIALYSRETLRMKHYSLDP
jgi:hypothetical protein